MIAPRFTCKMQARYIERHNLISRSPTNHIVLRRVVGSIEKSQYESTPSMSANAPAPSSIETIIRRKLMVALEPTRLDVINDSHRHAGHRSSPGTGESHFTVVVVSPAFAGQSRIARHRLVNAALDEELRGRVHALAIKAFAPGERLDL